MHTESGKAFASGDLLLLEGSNKSAYIKKNIDNLTGELDDLCKKIRNQIGLKPYYSSEQKKKIFESIKKIEDKILKIKLSIDKSS